MRGVFSEAMVMCASSPDCVEILDPPSGSVPGDKVVCEGYPGTPDAQLNPKKKVQLLMITIHWKKIKILISCGLPVGSSLSFSLFSKYLAFTLSHKVKLVYEEGNSTEYESCTQTCKWNH